jgi:hypothetical protein
VKKLLTITAFLASLGPLVASAQNTGGTQRNNVMPNMDRTSSTGASLGTVRIPQTVKADSQPLAAGSYTVRLTGDALEPALGQSPEREQWVEFVQNGRVIGRAVATVVPPDQVKEVGKAAAPREGSARVELLKGNEYLRVWLSKGGTSYLIHLPTTTKS